MKSIIEEGSSIVKAVEQAWQRAGMPAEFSVRIYEHPEKNFFGFTVKPAKVGIFFQEEKVRQDRPARQVQKNTRTKKTTQESVSLPATKQTQSKQKDARPLSKKATKRDGDIWTEQMVVYAKQWFTSLFENAGMQVPSFSLKPEKYHLKVLFDTPVGTDADTARIFYRASSHLLLQALRNTCKRPLKGYKVILTHTS